MIIFFIKAAWQTTELLQFLCIYRMFRCERDNKFPPPLYSASEHRNSFTRWQEGGETVFPVATLPVNRSKDLFSRCGNIGSSVKPAKGDAILFWSMKIGGELDGGSNHAGCPVLHKEKWTATKWLHVSPASVPEAHQRVFQEGREVGWADCRDSNDACHAWSLQNECVKNPSFMLKGCPLSCGKCFGIWKEGQYTWQTFPGTLSFTTASRPSTGKCFKLRVDVKVIVDMEAFDQWAEP